MSEILVSIIIPVYNVQRYVKRCATALFSQTLKSGVEYIFVDDASPDNSIGIIKQTLKEFPERINQCQFIHHEKNRGLTAARNSGLRAAHGKYVLHTDSDDWMEDNMVETMFNTAINNASDIVYCDFFFEYNNAQERYFCPKWDQHFHRKSLCNYIQSTWTVIWNILAKRELYTENGLSSLEGVSFYEDFNLAAKLFLKAKSVSHINIPLQHYNQVNSSSIMHTFGPKHFYDELNACVDVIEYYKSQNELENYKRPLAYRFIKAQKEYLLSSKTQSLFLSQYPDFRKYILSCPYINKKVKLLGWCRTHHLSAISIMFVHIRNFYLRYKQ